MNTDKNLSVDEWVDFEVELPDNSNNATTCQYVHPDTRVSASLSERGQGHFDSEVRASRSLPRNTNPHEIESGFVEQVGFLGSKTGQLERSFAPGSQSSPAARLARHTQQQQQGSCSAVTASPFAEDKETPLFSVNKNPYISPVITNNIGIGKDAGNSTADFGKKNSSCGTAETHFSTCFRCYYECIMKIFRCISFYVVQKKFSFFKLAQTVISTESLHIM